MTGFNWKKHEDNIVGIQILFSNGKKSPLFLGRNQTEDNLQKVEINSKVKIIKGTESGLIVSNIHFLDKDRNEITRISAYEKDFGPD